LVGPLADYYDNPPPEKRHCKISEKFYNQNTKNSAIQTFLPKCFAKQELFREVLFRKPFQKQSYLPALTI
jgi:hypothetical protein